MPVKRPTTWADALALWLALLGFAAGIMLLVLCGCGAT